MVWTKSISKISITWHFRFYIPEITKKIFQSKKNTEEYTKNDEYFFITIPDKKNSANAFGYQGLVSVPLRLSYVEINFKSGYLRYRWLFADQLFVCVSKVLCAFMQSKSGSWNTKDGIKAMRDYSENFWCTHVGLKFTYRINVALCWLSTNSSHKCRAFNCKYYTWSTHMS